MLQQLSDCQRVQGSELSRLMEMNRVLLLENQALMAARATRGAHGPHGPRPQGPRFQGSRPRSPAGVALRAPSTPRFQLASSLYSAQGGQPGGQPGGQGVVYPQLAVTRLGTVTTADHCISLV